MQNDNRTPHTQPEQPLLYSVLRDFKEQPKYTRECKDALVRITFSATINNTYPGSVAEDVDFIDKIYDLLCLIERAVEEEEIEDIETK